MPGRAKSPLLKGVGDVPDLANTDHFLTLKARTVICGLATSTAERERQRKRMIKLGASGEPRPTPASLDKSLLGSNALLLQQRVAARESGPRTRGHGQRTCPALLAS